jgi:hypothetical protein
MLKVGALSWACRTAVCLRAPNDISAITPSVPDDFKFYKLHCHTTTDAALPIERRQRAATALLQCNTHRPPARSIPCVALLMTRWMML